ncbi:hypothetical protein [Corynebacterium sp. CCM 9203]|uniref:hypothetical protein n=1 Tax=Corynebacterium sp. CCM 9203 TaxID=3057615 RepID=UPI003525C443
MTRTLGLTVSLVLLLLGSPTAVADQPEDLQALSRISPKNQDPFPTERPLGAQRLEDRLSAIEPLYTDREVAELTVFGFGRAAEMNPELARLFRRIILNRFTLLKSKLRLFTTNCSKKSRITMMKFRSNCRAETRILRSKQL